MDWHFIAAIEYIFRSISFFQSLIWRNKKIRTRRIENINSHSKKSKKKEKIILGKDKNMTRTMKKKSNSYLSNYSLKAGTNPTIF